MSLAFKALTLPKHDFEETNRSKTVVEAKVDLLLLFLCRTPISDEDLDLCDGSNSVLLYLHVITPYPAKQFSTPYRLLKIDRDVFVSEVLDKGCVLPKKFFVSCCKKDFLQTRLTYLVKTQTRYKTNFIRTYSDFNTFFQNLYKNTNFQPLKMFTVAYYFFASGSTYDTHLVSVVFDKYTTATESTNPKEGYHLMNYMIRRYATVPFQETNTMIEKFSFLVKRFQERSVETFQKLSEISKQYTHEEDGGVVCSYVLSKSFVGFDQLDFILPSHQEKFDSMLNSFEQSIKYFNSTKFEEVDTDVLKNLKVSTVSSKDLTRYILKTSADQLFGMNIKKGELKHFLTKKLLRYYGTFPPPAIEMRSANILCEMMSGAFNERNQFASCEILDLKPFKPILTKWKGCDYRVLTLNSLNIDKPIPSHVLKAINRHLKNPSLATYMGYCVEIVNHIEVNDYYFNETVNPFLPIYTVDFDIDIYDKQFIHHYYESEDQWAVKEQMFHSLKDLVLFTCHEVLKFDVTTSNTTFFMYESIRDDLDQINKPNFKLGLRLIVKFSTICFKNSSVVDQFQKILNVYRCRFDFLRRICDENIFDSAIYNQPSHEIRLPMNLKPDGTKPLVPVLFRYHSENFLCGLIMTTSLLHLKNHQTDNIQFIYQLSLPCEEMIDKFDTSNVYKMMFLAKSNKKTQDLSAEESLKVFKFTSEQKHLLIDTIDRFSQGRLKQRSNRLILKILLDKPLKHRGKNKFEWCSGLKFCAITAHAKSLRNPCDYFVTLNRRANGQHECFVYCRCYSPRCQEQTRRNCIGKCLL